MANLLEYISDVSSQKEALITEEETYTYGYIRELYLSNKSIIDTLLNSCVVINSRSRIECILLLSILDGNVKRILLLAEDISDKALVEEYYKEANVNYEVYLDKNILKLRKIDFNVSINETNETQWIIPTSGTTNNPKLVMHTLSSLTRTTKRSVDDGKRYIWGLTFDIYRFSGIQVFLQAMAGGSCLVVPESDYSMSRIVSLFLKTNCNIISSTPSFWRKILMIRESALLKLKRATLGGEISDEGILTALKNRYNDIKIVHIYASTEVGVGFAVTDGKAGFPYEYIINGYDKIKLKIDKKSVLWIKLAKNIQNYILEKSIYDDEGYINTGDLVEVRDDRVYFLGRQSGSINVGGNKVQPEEIEEKLLRSNLIHSVYAYAKKNPILGSLVCVDIVPLDLDEDKTKLKKQIQSYCRDNLENFKIPAFINIVDELEITKSGKIKRN